MKFLLAALNAKFIHSNPAVYSLRACAGEALRQYVELAEYTINQAMQEILADIYRRRPAAVGFSCYIWNWRLVRELLAEIPKLLPETDIWLGGPEASYGAEAVLKQYPQLRGIMIGEGEETFRELLAEIPKLLPETEIWLGGPEASYGAEAVLKQYPQLRGIMIGEGEETFRELLEYYVEKNQPEEPGNGRSEEMTGRGILSAAGEFMAAGIREGGLPYERDDARLRCIRGLCLPTGYTSPRVPVDMSRIPFLYQDLSPFENRIIYYESSRGCPFRCSYCLSSLEKQVRFRDIDIVKRELQFFLDNRVKQVKFVDRTFNCSHEHTMEIWRYIRENDNGVTNFHFEITADILREDEIALLNSFRPGLAQLEIGVQSLNPDTLRAIRRVMDVEKLENAVTAVRRAGNVHLHLDLIAGLPYEDYGSFAESFNHVYRMQPEQLQLGFLKVLKGSEMWERAQEYGILYLEEPPYEVLSTRWLRYEEVLRLKRVEEMLEIYYNSGQFIHTLPFLEKAFPSPFAMYEALAGFYEGRGYFTASPARAYRYQVLLEFAMENDAGRGDIYRELLTYDIYLREKPKSRPEFAVDPSPYKEAIKNFYREEEKARRLLPDYYGFDWRQLSKMTHLEAFAYPVWDIGQMRQGYEEWGREKDAVETCAARPVCFILFDYRRRNPVDHGAMTQRVKCGKIF